MIHELYLNKAAKTKDEQHNVAIPQSPSSHLTENHRKTCYGYAIMKACSRSLHSYQAGNLSCETESELTVIALRVSPALTASKEGLDRDAALWWPHLEA